MHSGFLAIFMLKYCKYCFHALFASGEEVFGNDSTHFILFVFVMQNEKRFHSKMLNYTIYFIPLLYQLHSISLLIWIENTHDCRIKYKHRVHLRGVL